MALDLIFLLKVLCNFVPYAQVTTLGIKRYLRSKVILTEHKWIRIPHAIPMQPRRQQGHNFRLPKAAYTHCEYLSPEGCTLIIR